MDYYLINGTDLHVEEFVIAEDHTAVAIDSTAAEMVLRIRREAGLARAISEAEATAAGPVPTELPFRHFLPPAPLVLSDGEPLYRTLFAGWLSSVDELLRAWGMTPTEEPHVAGVARRTGVEWRLRDVGPGVAWSVDLTASPKVAGRLLPEIRSAAREHGLIPVTVERFR